MFFTNRKVCFENTLTEKLSVRFIQLPEFSPEDLLHLRPGRSRCHDDRGAE